MTPQIFTPFRGRRPAAARVALLASLLCLCAVGVVTSRSQDTIQDTIHERELEDGIPGHLPIKVKVKNPDKFKDLKNERWLGDLELEVKNTGNRPIYFLRLGIFFVDVKRDSGAEIGYGLTYGRSQLMDINNRATPEDVPILPGATHTFRVGRKSVEGWNWYRTKVEVKPHPKKIGLQFEALNFGDGTGFVTTSGLPVPEERGACEGGREGRASTARIRPGPPPTALFRKASFFLPAAFLPVNFFSADTRGPAPGESAPQSCCPGTQCERMKIIIEGDCFCDHRRQRVRPDGQGGRRRLRLHRRRGA